ncbi:MAG: hypothetical protein H6610_09080 [Ignavibacteriales bacterium]|nr:hypothetical protein [Ignavibacteriales bacterium]MCB9257802.1 hypothetical protein [Ignavibacteriales bacterium]
MRQTEQKRYFETLKRYERKFTSDELKEYKMLFKRHKDDEDLDNISFNKLKDLYTKYYTNREKIDINELFKKK